MLLSAEIIGHLGHTPSEPRGSRTPSVPTGRDRDVSDGGQDQGRKVVDLTRTSGSVRVRDMVLRRLEVRVVMREQTLGSIVLHRSDLGLLCEGEGSRGGTS